MKYILSILFFIFAISVYSQSRDLPPNQKEGACYAKCLLSKNRASHNVPSEVKEYPVYIGETPDKVKLKTITIEVKKPIQSWVLKVKDNCESKNEKDCLVWCLTDTPGEYMELEVLKNKRKLKEDEWGYRVVEVFKSNSSSVIKSTSEWKEVLCGSKISKEFIQDLKMQLTEKGFDSESESLIYDSRTKSALKKYQEYNNLPIGQLNFETLEALGLKHHL